MDSIRSFSHRNDLLNLFAYTRVLFTPLEIMPRSVSSPAMAGLEFLTG
jgi:hypothetical protein